MSALERESQTAALERESQTAAHERESQRPARVVEATVIEELPSLLYRLELGNKAQVLAHGMGSAPQKSDAEKSAGRNWVRLLPGDRVEIEFAERDPTRGRIVKKLG
jgi:translation initiation factor IF-1